MCVPLVSARCGLRRPRVSVLSWCASLPSIYCDGDADAMEMRGWGWHEDEHGWPHSSGCFSWHIRSGQKRRKPMSSEQRAGGRCTALGRCMALGRCTALDRLNSELAAAGGVAAVAAADVQRRGASRLQLCGKSTPQPPSRATGQDKAVQGQGQGQGWSGAHLRRDWAHPAHICAGTGLTPPTSAPGLGSV